MKTSMAISIKKAAVLGAGTMGSRIAAHLANAGVDCLLLDLAVPDATSVAARNGIVQQAFKGLGKSRPPAVFSQSALKHLRIGNFQDDLERIADADWICEVIVEKMEPKRELLARVDALRKPGSVVTSNTSGLPIAALAEGRSEDFRKHWLGTHFFNPPRHMRLVELIATPETDQALFAEMADFCDRRLGKVVVEAKDRPNFIANRIFLFSVMHTLKTMTAHGLTVEEVDALTGPLVGRPRMASFRLADFTGIDICYYVAKTIYDLVPDDENRDVYSPPAFLKEMLDKGMLGDKSGGGFYKRDKRAPGGRLVLDIDKLDYREMRQPHWDSVDAASKNRDLGGRIKQLISSDDPAGRFLWETLSSLFLYAAARIPEVTDSLVSVDTVMKAGFNWQKGIFEIWTDLGVEETCERMRSDGKTLPPIVEKALASSAKSFYSDTAAGPTYFELQSGEFQAVPKTAGVLRLAELKHGATAVESNRGASLWDMGDGIALLEFHSKGNSLDENVFTMLRTALERVESEFDALVIGNEGDNFSFGANLQMLLQMCMDGNWSGIGESIDQIQGLTRSLRACSKPTVAAVFSQTLGGGCEIAMHCAHTQAAAETYMGLVEVGVGLIPGAGGCVELLRRHTAGLTPADDTIPATRAAFETIGMAKVSGSATEATERKFLRPTDGVTMNRDRLLADAKQAALGLVAAGYEPVETSEVLVGGKQALAALELGLWMMQQGMYASEYDVEIGKRLAQVLSGGPLTEPTLVSADYLLGLEKEAFLSLCGEERTQQRMGHLLKTGKPLRN